MIVTSSKVAESNGQRSVDNDGFTHFDHCRNIRFIDKLAMRSRSLCKLIVMIVAL